MIRYQYSCAQKLLCAHTVQSSTEACRLGGASRNRLIGAGGLRNVLTCADVLSSVLVELICVKQRYSMNGCLPFHSSWVSAVPLRAAPASGTKMKVDQVSI